MAAQSTCSTCAISHRRAYRFGDENIIYLRLQKKGKCECKCGKHKRWNVLGQCVLENRWLLGEGRWLNNCPERKGVYNREDLYKSSQSAKEEKFRLDVELNSFQNSVPLSNWTFPVAQCLWSSHLGESIIDEKLVHSLLLLKQIELFSNTLPLHTTALVFSI